MEKVTSLVGRFDETSAVALGWGWACILRFCGYPYPPYSRKVFNPKDILVKYSIIKTYIQNSADGLPCAVQALAIFLTLSSIRIIDLAKLLRQISVFKGVIRKML